MQIETDPIKNQLALTLQATMQKLGLLPNEVGGAVKKILAGDDLPLQLSLGCWLDDCREAGSYKPLQEGLAKVPLERIN